MICDRGAEADVSAIVGRVGRQNEPDSRTYGLKVTFKASGKEQREEERLLVQREGALEREPRRLMTTGAAPADGLLKIRG